MIRASSSLVPAALLRCARAAALAALANAATLLRGARTGALALAALAVLALGVPAAAQADELVSNFNHTGDADDLHISLLNAVGVFTTGGRAATLTSIEFRLSQVVSRSAAPTLKLYTFSVANRRATPDMEEVATFITPSTSLTTNSFQTFTYDAPSGTSLTASTAYIFVLESPSAGIVVVETTADPSEDAGKADGWTIDGSGTGTSPYYIDAVRQIVVRVNGTTTPNAAPTAADNTVTMAEDGRYEFSATDFGFNDMNPADRLVSVRIVTVPAAGRLALDGATVISERVVTRARIDNGDLTFEPAIGGSGDDYASFTFKVNDGTVFSDAAYTMRIDVTATPVLTGQIFVNNTEETETGNAFNLVADNQHSQSFTTGPNRGGYILTSIGAVASLGDAFSVAVHTADTNGVPVALHASLIPPGNFPAGLTTIHFHAPPNTRLNADATYTIVLGRGSTPPGHQIRGIKTTPSNADNAGASGWSIGDAYHYYTSVWKSSEDGRSAKIVIRGNAVRGVTNYAPVFSPASVALDIAENTAAGEDIGAAVAATDDDNDTLAYTLGGADAASFDFVEASGQIRTKSGVSYDHEVKSSYTVTVTVTDGTATAVANVTISVTDVDEPPDAPATPAVSAVAGSTTSLSVSWIAPANAGRPAIDSYDVQYRVSGAEDWTDGPDHSTTTAVTGPVSYRLYAAQVTGLIVDTLYEARVRATNADGDSGWSDPPGSGRTNASGNNAPVFSPAIVDRYIAENTAAGQNVGAAVTATDADAGDSLTYTLGGADMASFDFVETTGQIRTKSGVIYDHETKSSYKVTVTASDGTATADADVTISVTDVDEGPPDAPATPTVSAVPGSITSLTVSWDAPANDGRPAIDSYDVQYRVGSSGSWTDSPEDVTGTSTTTTVTGLVADTSYEVRVRATNAEGDSGWSDPPGSGRTNALTNILPVFSSSNVSRDIEENTAAGEDIGAAVAATDDDAGDTLSYTLGGTDAGSFDFVGTTGQIRTKSGVSYDFEAKSSYTVTVTVTDGTATAVANVTISVTDVDEPPDAPATPMVSAVSGSTPSLSVSWTAPANEGRPPIESYSVQWRVSGATVSGAKDVTTTTTIISELVANTEYEVRVGATNAEGDSGWSDPPWSGRTNTLTNNAATGAPTITGTAQVGQTLTAVTTGIMDADGLTTPNYTYQWIRVDGTEADISSANSSTYTLVDADLGTTLKVKVTFADELSHTETLTSAATATVTAAATTTGVTVSTTALTVTEEDTTGASYTVVLNTQPTANVTVTVAGHAGTDVTPSPTSLTFTPTTWGTARTVTVTAGPDADTADDAVSLTHSATSTDTDYNGIAIAGVDVTVNDNDTAQVMGVGVAPGNAHLVVTWTAVDNATGYTVQWTSGGEDYNTGDRQATVTPGSTTRYMIPGLINGTEYTVRVIATRTGDDDGTPSREMNGTPAVQPPPPPPPPTTGGGGGGGGGGRGRPPSYPGTIQAESGDGEVTLRWGAPSSQGSSRIQYYEYRIDGEGEWISTGSTNRTHTIMGLINGRVYFFHLRAASAAGAGSHRISPEATPVADLDFTHFANGGFITSTLALVNAGAYPVRPAIYFYDQDGDPIEARRVVDLTPDLEVGDDGALRPRTVMNPLSELTIASHGRGGQRVGSVTVRAPSSIGGVLRFDIPNLGVAGVGDSPTLRDALLPVRRQDGGINTGVAVRNRGTSTLTLQCRLMRDGAVLEETMIPLAANGQDSRFIDQVFPAADTSDFTGSVRCTAPEAGRFSAVAFELDGVHRIFTTLPVVPVPAVPEQEQEEEQQQDATRLDFTHFANGGKIVSSLVLVNAGADPVRPAVYFYDQQGDPIAAQSLVDLTEELEIGDDGALRPDTAIDPLGELTISSHGRGVLKVGSVTVTAEGPIGGVLRFDIPALGVAGVGDSPPIRDALVPVRRQTDGINTGLAIHNRGTTALLVRCRLMRDGAVLEETMIPLAANGQDARFIDQVFPTADTSDFVGSVRCLTPEPGRFSAVAFELDGVDRIFTTLPVVPVVEVP